jgi:hypothetical protein
MPSQPGRSITCIRPWRTVTAYGVDACTAGRQWVKNGAKGCINFYRTLASRRCANTWGSFSVSPKYREIQTNMRGTSEGFLASNTKWICNERGRQLRRPLSYFWGGALTGIWGTVLITLTLPSEAWLLRVSRTRKNFSASMRASSSG